MNANATAAAVIPVAARAGNATPVLGDELAAFVVVAEDVVDEVVVVVDVVVVVVSSVLVVVVSASPLSRIRRAIPPFPIEISPESLR